MSERACNNSSCAKESCAGCSSNTQGASEDMTLKANANSHIKNIIGIMSGKGGVGKSMMAASFAVELAKKGYQVGILDADVTGPSIPKMFGIEEKASAKDDELIPAMTKNHIKIMSVNLLLPNAEDPVIWRGPVIASVVKQFFTEVCWGELDYLLVDMPPGTGDVPLTVFQSLPIDGVVIVTSPQDLVKLIVKKAYKMAVMMDIPVFGLVENYSYLECPDCGKKISVFGESKVEEVATQLGVEVYGKMPICPSLAKEADEGLFADSNNPYIAQGIEKLIAKEQG